MKKSTKIRGSSIFKMSFVTDFLLLLVALVWGASYSVTKGALAFTPVLFFLVLRFGLTFLVLIPFTYKELYTAPRSSLFSGGLLGLILFSIFLCETYGVAYTSASNAAFLISLCVVLTPIVDALLKKSIPNPILLLATGICVLGTWLLTSGQALTFNVGDSLILLAAFLRALMVSSTKRVTDNYTLSSMALTQIQMGAVFIASLIVVFLFENNLSLPSSGWFWIRLLFLVLFCTLFAFFAQNYGVKHTNPARVSFLMGTEPVFGAMFAIYLLSEPFSFQLLVGGSLITAGTYLGMRMT